VNHNLNVNENANVVFWKCLEANAGVKIEARKSTANGNRRTANGSQAQFVNINRTIYYLPPTA